MGIASRRAIGALSIAAAVVVAGGLFYRDRDRAGTAAAERPPPGLHETENRVGALGRIEPESETLNIGSGVGGRLESLLVGRGDKVKKDQVLGYLQSYAEQAAQRDQIAAQLDEAKAQLAAETALDLARIDDASIKLDTILRVTPYRIEAQQQAVDSLKARLANDDDILQTLSQLRQKDFASRRSYADQQSLVAQDKANLASATAQLEQQRQQFALDRGDAEVQVRIAKATLEAAKANIPIASLTKQLALAQERVHEATVYAPIDGTILNVMAHAGEFVGGDKTIVTMGDTSHMRAVAEVYETDVSRIRLGQNATISSRALNKPIAGKVVEIGHLIFKNDVLNVDPAARADARVVDVRIELDDPARVAGLTNLTVDVLIDTTEPPTARIGVAGPADR